MLIADEVHRVVVKCCSQIPNEYPIMCSNPIKTEGNQIYKSFASNHDFHLIVLAKSYDWIYLEPNHLQMIYQINLLFFGRVPNAVQFYQTVCKILKQ